MRKYINNKQASTKSNINITKKKKLEIARLQISKYFFKIMFRCDK